MQSRSGQILAVLLWLILPATALAQATQKCGVVGVEGPDEVEPAKAIVFKAQLSLINSTKPDLKWAISAGTIMSGQGTGEITVDTAGLGGQDITATVEFNGVTPVCSTKASRTTRVQLPPACGIPLDQYGDIRFEDEKARLDNFAIQLLNQPTASGSILMYSGQKTYQNEAEERLSRAKSYLVDVRGVDRNQVLTVDCGFRTDLIITFYIVPLGATAPGCDPNGQVPLHELKFTKPRPKSRKRK